MRFHSLEIQGFGPFRDKQVIDFDELSQDRIFMFEGPTGAGKSSIIDAIVFALFGVTAHEAATENGLSRQRIRSNYCGPNDETKVALEFTTSGNRYRVTRTEAYEKPKVRGEGTTKENAAAKLQFIHPVHEAISQIREVNIRIKDILQLDSDQFSQMVVLPQGDFATFLHATSEERRALLEKIFKTFFYDALVAKIKEKSTELENSINARREDIRHHVRNLESEKTTSEIEYDFNELERLLNDDLESHDTKATKLDKLVKDILPLDDQTQMLVDVLRKQKAPIDTKLTLLRESEKRIQQKSKISAELDKLMANSAQIEEKRLSLQQYVKAQAINQLLVTRKEVTVSIKENQRLVFGDYREMSSKIAKAKIAKLTSELPAQTKQALEAEKAEEKLDDLQDALDTAIEQEEQAREIPKLNSSIKKLETEIAIKTQKLKEIRLAQKDGSLIEAAKKLKKNQPCPMCGSREHPKPIVVKGSTKAVNLDLLESELEFLKSNLNSDKADLRIAQNSTKKKGKSSTEIKASIKSLEKIAAKSYELSRKQEDMKDDLDTLNDALPVIVTLEGLNKTLQETEQKISHELNKLDIESEKELNKILGLKEDRLKGEIETFDNRVREIRTILDQEDYKELPDPDDLSKEIEQLFQSQQELHDKLKVLTDQIAVRTRIQNTLDKAKKGILASLKKIEDTNRTGEPYLKLKDWTVGVNPAGLSLNNFVLQERLELILDLASRHLRRISNSKFEFRIFEEKQGRKQRAGLGITIMDFHSGKERNTETLSGGETFYASLALALGLVEVVQNDNGGIELGTLFIDEGFGSLSEDTLEDVLDVLDELRNDRIIGIISHVQGMKSLVPTRLEVRPTDEGPSTTHLRVVGQV